MKKLLAAISFIILVSACKKTDTTDASIALQKDILNVSYGSDPAQVMDVYLPPNRSMSETNVLVMIHGGGWTGGDKADFTSLVDTIKRRLPNYAVFNINYRLAALPLHLFPAQEEDVQSAIRFIYSKREEYFISDNYALLGASAGGHLALLQSYKYNSPVKVKTVIDFFGPADMTAMYNNPVFPGTELAIFNVMGSTPVTDSMLYANSSPINFINSETPPTLIFHGGADLVVSHAQSDSLFSKLHSSNIPSTFITYPTQGHGWSNSDTLTDSFNHIQLFLSQHMP